MEFASLAGMTAVITGASSGIGREMALEFAQAGANLGVHYFRSHAAAEQTAQQVIELQRQATLFRADIRSPDDLTRLVEDAWQVLGRVDVWVNNAGVDLLTGDGAKLGYDAKLEQLLEGDVRSTLLLTRLVAKRMRDQGGGSVLNIGWDQADRGMEGDSGELFATSKNAIMGFTRSAALSYAPTVRINCIAPGWIRTAWGETASDVWQQRVLRETPLARWGTPQDIAKLARFLCSPDASFITGQVVNCNGGAVR